MVVVTFRTTSAAWTGMFTNYPESTKNISAKPSEYLRRFYYDTCVYDPNVLRTLIDRIGADRLVLVETFP